MQSVLIVDDHAVLAEAIADALERDQVAHAATLIANGNDVAAQVLAQKPDLVLLDLDLGHSEAGGLAVARAAREANLRVAILTGTTDQVVLGQCVQAGVVGIVSKQRTFSHVMSSVSMVLRGAPCNTDSELLQWVLAAQRQGQRTHRLLAPFHSLTNREQEVLDHLIDGRRVDEIARHDFVSPATVRSQIRAVLRKLGVRSQIAAIAAAHRSGWSQHRLESSLGASS